MRQLEDIFGQSSFDAGQQQHGVSMGGVVTAPRTVRLTFVEPLRAKNVVMWLTRSKITPLDIKVNSLAHLQYMRA